VYVETRLADPDADDDAFDALEDTIDEAARVLDEAGFELIVTHAGGRLGIAPLPTDQLGATDVARRALAAARKLAAPRAGVVVAAVVHAGENVRNLPEWAGDPEAGAFATAAALGLVDAPPHGGPTDAAGRFRL
jgi:sugar phosphate isomerase/epimerase